MGYIRGKAGLWKAQCDDFYVKYNISKARTRAELGLGLWNVGREKIRLKLLTNTFH